MKPYSSSNPRKSRGHTSMTHKCPTRARALKRDKTKARREDPLGDYAMPWRDSVNTYAQGEP